MENLTSPYPCFRYDNIVKDWCAIEGQVPPPTVPNREKLVISTYNVLFNTRSNWTRPFYKVKDTERWSWIIKTKLPQLNSDIACFNESVFEFVEIAKQDPFIRSHYYISHIKMRGYGGFVLSKFPFQFIHFSKTRLLLLFQTQEEEPLCLVSLHLCSAENGANRRKRQVSDLFEDINELAVSERQSPHWNQVALALSRNNLIVLGDMNYIGLGETRFMYELGFRDKWLDIKQLDPGFTWDAKLNPFIRKLWSFAGRRMRLDRIFVKENSTLIKFASIEIFGQEGIGVKHLLPEYRGSDHFGLTAEIYLDPFMQEQHDKFEYFQREDEILRGRDTNSYGDSMYKLFV